MPPPRKQVFLNLQLSAEPLATHYRRRAEAYRFIHDALREMFGAAALKTLHRQTAAGPVQMNLDDELAQMTALFEGAALVTARQLGMADVGKPLIDDDATAAAARRFISWTAGVDRDPDVGRDVRMMVPVFYDLQRKKTKVWAFLGWKSRRVYYELEAKPSVRTFDAAGKLLDPNAQTTPEVNWNGAWTMVQVPVVVETYVTKLLDRDEFRRHCDTYRSQTAILANLE
jgi:hypothetical protein